MSSNNVDDKLYEIAGNVIKKIRNNKNISLEELANRINHIVTRQQLFKYENGSARMKTQIFNQICLALDYNPSDVWKMINNQYYSNTSTSKVSDDDEILFYKYQKLKPEDKELIKNIIETRQKQIDKELGED
jgi:transcriptional regulator with XRE-family HTH domain